MNSKRTVILTCRRSGASGIHRLLREFIVLDDLGNDPFLWTRPLRTVSQLFHDNRREEARQELTNALARGVFFKHSYDLESREFNRMLLDALLERKYQVVRVERADSASRIFSLLTALVSDCWGREEFTAYKDRVISGERIRIDPAFVRRTVIDQINQTQWFNQQFAESGLPVFEVGFEEFYRDGVGVLGLTDRLFEYVGVGSRAALLADETVLRFAQSGEHHTKALLQYSEEFRSAYAAIEEVLAEFQ